MPFEPDYTQFEKVLRNERPQRLPLYEHIVSPGVMERITGREFAGLAGGDERDLAEFFSHYCRFFREMTYDVVSFEYCITEVLPGHGAIKGGHPGPIQNRADFDAYPWDEVPVLFRRKAEPLFRALLEHLPPGMKAVGGVGNGVFEISEDLVGMECLPLMQVDDPELYRDLFVRIGDLMADIWREFLRQFAGGYAAGRFGDDLGFKSSLLTNPATVRRCIMPEYRKIIGLIHGAGLPFLWHSCGCIFEVMEDAMEAGINAKHSNEDAVAPFARWIELYGDRIGLLGGFDMDFLCLKKPDEIFREVLEQGRTYRRRARGYALGSGNSIPDYVPTENYLAMVRAAQHLRAEERTP